MDFLTAADGTRLAHHRRGDGPPLLCVPGGPLRDSAYLGGLGGLDAYRELRLLDLRGTGGSDRPLDPQSYRCDRQVDDVESLRRASGLERVDLLAHSAGAEIAVQYVLRRPDRVARLVLLTPSAASLGFADDFPARRRAYKRRSGPQWYPSAHAALERIAAGEAEGEDWAAVRPFTYGRWDSAAREHAARSAQERNQEGASHYYAPEAFDPPAARAALRDFTGQVLVVAGELDGGPTPERAAEIASAFPRGRAVVLPGAAHFPWLDDAERFTAAVNGFLRLR
ncbi:alpha/beta hydrolase [Streptomyces sp. P38-E01]|uniref:Alpha/beta hydrolase n=1 Tax=Streptomyces tardus TaxID=2780544 RepID=A0A949JK09_9ACTN|nr:alpha/beta hydrolase [Streptomyces tardus]MBU7600164.1 alpha/beta hydrolase [Streptomyces tardus]